MNLNLSATISSLETFSRIILIPWTFHHLQLALHLSINRAISINGLLWSSYMFGRVLGKNIFFGYPGNMTPKLCYVICLILIISFLFLSISTRTSVICLCYSFIGLAGGIIRTCYYKNDDNPHFKSAIISTHSKTSHQEALALIFVPLLAGLTYNSAVTSRFPALVLCLFGAFVSGVVFLAQFMCQRRIFWGSKQKSVSGNQVKVVTKRQTPKKIIPDVNSIEPPQEFLDLCGGNRQAAQKKYHQTLVWRAENDVNEIVEVPQDFFDEILRFYPHGIQGRSRTGGVVCYEQIGQGSASELKKHGITPEHLLRHFMLRNEFILQRCHRDFHDGDIEAESDTSRLSDGPLCTHLMTVLDVKGIKFSDFSADVIRFIQLSADVMDHHYPGCVERLVICNTPSWFFSIWSVVARVLPESIKRKVVTIDDVSKLDEYIDPKMRPPEYGGTGTPLRESHDHKALVAASRKWKETKTENNPLPATVVAPIASKQSAPVPAPEKKWGWFGMSKKNASTEAYLGEENKFYYDAATGRWILEDKTEETRSRNDSVAEQKRAKDSFDKPIGQTSMQQISSTKQSPKKGRDTMTLDQIEEHGLVLAIQAAHHASRLQQQNITSFSSSSGFYLATVKGLRDNDQEEAGLDGRLYPSVPFGAPRERKSGSKSLTRSRSLPIHRDDTESSDGEDNFVHFEEKPSAELFLVVLGMHLMSCLLLGTIIVALPVWMTMPTRGGGLGYSVKDCAIVMSTAGVLVLLAQIQSDQRIQVSLRAFPVRTFRVGVGSLAFFCFLLAEFGSMNRHQFTGYSGSKISVEIPPSDGSNDTFGSSMVWLFHMLLGLEHFTSPTAQSDGNVVSGSYWVPTPSGNPLTMIIPGILIGSVLCCAYLARKSAANLLHISLSSVISSPSKVQHGLSAAAAVLAPSTSCLLLRWSHRLHLNHPMNDSFFLTLVACAALLLYIFSLMLTVKFRGEFGILSDDTSVSLYENESHNLLDIHSKSRENSTLGIQDLFAIPYEDIRHLRALFPGGKKNKDTGILSARLFSLKLDLKDA